ncbi:hypothetical protein RF55_10565 [Lasius niger]|uniref:Gag-pol polyprotein n=1 Tax=Lasius niger TaxID=67767 RepID=A0A0J7KH52_LASNI|nr:hypothetical protein RF55_10565 [Lasius niger]
MTNLDARITLQRSRFSLIQEATDFESENVPRSDRPLVNARLDMLEQNWNKFQEEHENLCLSTNEDWSEHSYLRERVYERCQAFYIYARAKLQNHLEEFDFTDRQSRSTSSEKGASASLMPRSALPRIKLPTFSGDYQLWRSFHDLFASLIKDNSDLTNVEKMHYLKTCVTGEAARLVGNLSVAGDNFPIAWNILVARYENKRFLITAQLDRIVNLKPLKTKSAQGLRLLLTTISEAIAALRSLGCAVESWDPLLLHHIVKLLDSESREAWEIKLGSSTTFPTFTQFEEFLVGRTRALENLNLTTSHGSTTIAASSNKYKTKVAAHVAAPSSNLNSLACPLCGSSHHLSKCESYQTKTAKQRKDLIIKHKRCFNCLAPHLVKKCNSTRRCMKCGKKHHTTIHENNRESSSSHSSNTTVKKTATQSEKKLDPKPSVE